MKDRIDSDSKEDTREDLLAGTTIFAQALGTLIQNGEGVLVTARGPAEEYFGPKEGLILVANMNNRMEVMPLSDILDDSSDFKEGMIVTIGEPSDDETEIIE
jgi:hypothetical protein